MSDMFSVVAGDKTIIVYRPALNNITGSVTATIFLQQAIYWYEVMGRKPFYKYSAPAPDSPSYRAGDSWQEELGFTRSEFETARRRTSLYVKGGAPGKHDTTTPIIYWRDSANRTWYRLNVEVVNKIIHMAYARMQESCNRESGNPAIQESETTHRLQQMSALAGTEVWNE